MPISMPSSSRKLARKRCCDCLTRFHLAAVELPRTSKVSPLGDWPAETDVGGELARRPQHRPACASISSRRAAACEAFSPGPVARELHCHAAGTRSALQCKLQCFGTRFACLVVLQAEALQPVGDDVEVVVLAKWIERKPEAKTL